MNKEKPTPHEWGAGELRVCLHTIFMWKNNQKIDTTFFWGGIRHPPVERKEGDIMVTYSDLIQFCIFIVALVGLYYEIFKGKRK